MARPDRHQDHGSPFIHASTGIVRRALDELGMAREGAEAAGD